MNGHLVTVLPVFKKIRIPINRDNAFILFVALNELVMGFETYLAHVMNGTIRFNEWIPIVCGPLFALMLIVSLFASKKKPDLALTIATVALVCSIVVGILGTYFHIVRAIRPLAAMGERLTFNLLIWGAPAFAPPTFILVGILGLVAISGSPGGALSKVIFRKLPLSKDRIYFLLASMGVLIATVSSLFDHLRGGFQNPWLWVPVLSGTLGMVVALILALIERPQRGDLTIYFAAMLLLLVVGPLGLLLHILFDLGPGGVIVLERFLKGAPILAPMVFANMGLLGSIVMLDPD